VTQHVLYVYAIGRAGHAMPEQVEAVDGSTSIAAIEANGLAAFYTAVDASEFSQPVIDARSKDVEWLGGIGYRHQSVMAALMRGGTVIPLRAFTFFASETTLRDHLRGERQRFSRILERLEGKEEWTLRIEFEPTRWSDALVGRVGRLRDLAGEVERAASGKAFLLRKKFDEEKKRASREAEQQVVAEVEKAVIGTLECDTVAESRQERSGGFPQINVLIERDEGTRLAALRDELTQRYEKDGISVALTGPWPPYTFAGMRDEG
jgi:Gas vesicle synthesis protein GvpL/GvpF